MAENYVVDFKENKDKLEIDFSGQLTIANISKITERVKSNLKNPSNVLINVDNVDNLDISFIQLLHAIKNSGKKKGFEVQVSISVSDDISSLLSHAGFLNYLKEKN